MQNKISPRVPVYNIFITQEDIKDITDTNNENYIIWIQIFGANVTVSSGKQSLSNRLYITSDSVLPDLKIILCNEEERNEFEATHTGGTQILNTNIGTSIDVSFDVPSKYGNESSLYFILWLESTNQLLTSEAIPVSFRQIKIENSTTGSSIYYTTSGNDPLNTDNLYSAPFSVFIGTTVKAKAFKEGMRSSDVATLTVN